jgi:hypothetical protein
LLLLFIVVVLCFNVGQEVSKVARAKEDILQSLVTDRQVQNDVRRYFSVRLSHDWCMYQHARHAMLVTGDMTRRQH